MTTDKKSNGLYYIDNELPKDNRQKIKWTLLH